MILSADGTDFRRFGGRNRRRRIVSYEGTKITKKSATELRDFVASCENQLFVAPGSAARREGPGASLYVELQGIGSSGATLGGEPREHVARRCTVHTLPAADDDCGGGEEHGYASVAMAPGRPSVGNSKSEARNSRQIQTANARERPAGPVLVFRYLRNLEFELVSDFEIRASDLPGFGWVTCRGARPGRWRWSGR
jgi:hypothetical protein